MRYQRLLGCLGFSAIAILVSRTPVLSETATKSPLEIRLVPPAPLPPAEPATPTSAPVTGNDCGAKITTENNQSQRVELYYYRDAISMVELLGKIPLPGGCATHLPLNSFHLSISHYLELIYNCGEYKYQVMTPINYLRRHQKCDRIFRQPKDF